jgi:hypothetical protein
MPFSFRQFLDTGDLTWNREFDLVCPVNRVGVVDVFQVSQHGLDVSNNPVLIRSIEPSVAVLDNGATKGCTPLAFAALKETPSIEAIYQVHKNPREDGATVNTADEFIAKLAVDCHGEFLKMSVAPDGKSYTMLIASSEHSHHRPRVLASQRCLRPESHLWRAQEGGPQRHEPRRVTKKQRPVLP